MTKINIPDNYYTGFSFIHDFGYDSEIEIKNIEELLKTYDLEYHNKNIENTMYFINELNKILQEHYEEAVNKYSEWMKNQKIVRGHEPFIIILAKEIFVALVVGSIIKGSSIVLKKILTDKKEDTEDEKIIKEILDKMDSTNNQIKLEIKKTYKIEKKITEI